MIVDEIDEDDVLDYLEHVGVKGMRWGVRKAAGNAADRALGGETTNWGAAKRGATKPVTVLTETARAKPIGEKGKRRLSRADKAVVGLAAFGIGYQIGQQLRKHQAVKMARVRTFNNNAAQLRRTADLVNNIGGVKMHEVRTAFKVSSTGVATPVIRRIAG